MCIHFADRERARVLPTCQVRHCPLERIWILIVLTEEEASGVREREVRGGVGSGGKVELSDSTPVFCIRPSIQIRKPNLPVVVVAVPR